MSDCLLFAKISEPEITVVNFDDQFCDHMGEVDRVFIDLFPRFCKLRPYDMTNGEVKEFLV